MRLLFISPYYPFTAAPAWGAPSERLALSLRDFCDEVEVLVPRPYAPPLLSMLVNRWQHYRQMSRHEVRHGIHVHRPFHLHVPRLGGRVWDDPGAFLWYRRFVKERHRCSPFHAVISVDLAAAGGLAWRVGRELGIPASGWAIGGDVHPPLSSSHRRVLRRAVQNLDLVLYQSRDLLRTVSKALGLTPEMMPSDRHVVLPRGVSPPPALPRARLRDRLRAEWHIAEDQLVVLNVGRLVRDKGIFELLEAISTVSRLHARIVCVLLGSTPSLDETATLRRIIEADVTLRGRIRILPACAPDRVWEHLCGADIFAFPSRREGMPNSLLEAMAIGLPAVAFGIQAVLEIENGTGCLLAVPPGDVAQFAESIVRLASSADERVRLGDKGSARVREHFMLPNATAEVVRRLRQLVVQRDATTSPR